MDLKYNDILLELEENDLEWKKITTNDGSLSRIGIIQCYLFHKSTTDYFKNSNKFNLLNLLSL